jgi:AGCS family alanine or glycine:cation symporter
VFVGSRSTLRTVWSFAYVANALMVLPNVISRFAMSNVVVLETQKYLWQGDIDAPEIPETTSAAAQV